MATMSKRAQARTERELQDLLSVPGNSTCADCGARNPAWASWSLGIFLCMRCATIHRKLGTHISKVKSLSMDTWSSDQVEAMRKNGNTTVNKMYNPTNKRPDMPLDADEVDNAMERFIRKKYQEKSLASGKPPVPSRDDPSTMRSRSPDIAPPPTLPSKKGKFFGFGLRASSSAYPFSKHDKKRKNEPRVDSAFRISSEDYTTATRTAGSRTEMSDQELQIKLGQLRDMGFSDNNMNTKMIKKTDGDVERAITALVKLGPSEKPRDRTATDAADSNRTFSESHKSAPNSAQLSNNPFDQLDQPAQQTGFGLSFGDQQQQQQQQQPQQSQQSQQSQQQQPQQQQLAPISTNPWQTPTSTQTNTGLEQSFAGMQVTQPLFPHNTGGYNPQIRHDPHYQQTMTPPVPSLPQQWSSTASPVIGTNPFMQQPLSAHSTGNNPYAAQMHTMPGFAPSTNPFFQQQSTTSTQQTSPSALVNPFGLPPSQSPPQARNQPNMAQPPSSIFDAPQQQQGQGYQNQQPQFQGQSPAMSSSGFSNLQYGHPQNQYQFQQQPQQQQQQTYTNPQPQYNNPYQQQQQQQQQTQPLTAQQTGRYAKNDILALFNHPTLAPQKPLASIPEPGESQQQSQQYEPNPQQQQQYHLQPRQALAPGPSNVYANQSNNFSSQKRSATMPVVSPSSNLNPFLQSTSQNPSNATTNLSPTPFSQNPYHQHQQYAPLAQTQGYNGTGYNQAYPAANRHVSADSVSVNNPNLMDGRHSPDAFASLSARSIR